MPDQESFLQLKSEIQTLKIKDEYRSKELDALMSKLDDTSSKLIFFQIILVGYLQDKKHTRQMIMKFVMN